MLLVSLLFFFVGKKFLFGPIMKMIQDRQKEIDQIIQELAFDDRIDLLEELPANLVDKILVKTTKEERHLWYDYLKDYPVRFLRQKILGKYIADFYSAEAKLVIELDGSKHFEKHNTEKDAERTAFLNGYGLTVLRIPNNEVSRNFRGVCEYIDAAVTRSLSQKSKDF